MAGGIPPGLAQGKPSPAEREARWTAGVYFAIEADDEKEAHAVLGHALAGLEPDLPLRGQPVIRPRHHGVPDNIWIAEVRPDFTDLQVIDPDDAKTRCAFVHRHFPMGVTWAVPQNSEREAKYEWPQDIWQRQPAGDTLLHPAVQGVLIFCNEKPA